MLIPKTSLPIRHIPLTVEQRRNPMSRAHFLTLGAILLVCLVIATSFQMVRGLSAPPVNDPPTAVDDSYTLHGNGTIGSLLANDSDPNNDPMSVRIVTFPTNGSLSGLNPGYYSYSRNSSSWTGTDSFTYK